MIFLRHPGASPAIRRNAASGNRACQASLEGFLPFFMCRLAASYRKEGKPDSPFFEASFVAHEKSPIERKTPLSLCGRISCITPALPPCVTPSSPFPLSHTLLIHSLHIPGRFGAPPYTAPCFRYPPGLLPNPGCLLGALPLCVTKRKLDERPPLG